MDVLRSKTMFKQWIIQIKAFIIGFSGVQLKPSRGPYADYYSVQFSYQVSRGVSIEVDLLVSPYWNDQHEFYNFLRQVPQGERIRYSYMRGIMCSKIKPFSIVTVLVLQSGRDSFSRSKKIKYNTYNESESNLCYVPPGSERVHSSSKGLEKQRVGRECGRKAKVISTVTAGCKGL